MQHLVTRLSIRFAVVLGCLPGDLASAAEHRAEGRLLIEAEEVVNDDLYCFGDEITIDGQIQGDVVAAGRLIRVNGTVEGDLICAAQAIVINGKVGDDVRMAGQVLKVDDQASIGDDVFAAGFSLETTEQSSIKGEMVYAGYQALLAGNVGENLTMGLVNCEISGGVDGDVDLSVATDQTGAQAYIAGSPLPIPLPQVPPGLTIRATTKIAGDLEYESPEQADIPAEAQVVGEMDYEPKAVGETPPLTPTEKVSSSLSKYGALFVVGLGVLLVTPTWVRGVSDNVRTRPFTCLGLGAAGIASCIVLPLIMLLTMIALAVITGFVQLTGLIPVVIVLGLSCIGMLLVSFWFSTAYLAKIVLSFVAGSWLLGLAKPTIRENRFLALFVGVVLLALISSVPYLGFIVGWMVVVLGLGALIGWLFRKIVPKPMLGA